MKVNGEQIQLTKATTLEEFLKEQGYNIQRIAIERNDEIVPRENFSDVMLSDSDIIEVLIIAKEKAVHLIIKKSFL